MIPNSRYVRGCHGLQVFNCFTGTDTRKRDKRYMNSEETAINLTKNELAKKQ